MNKTFVAAVFLTAAVATPAMADFAHQGTGFPMGGRPAKWCGTENHSNEHALEAGRRTNARAALRTIYLNMNGGTYSFSGGATDAATNKANIRGFSGTATIPPLLAQFDKTRLSNCVKGHFEKFNVRVVEQEPTSGDYIEAVVGGDGTEVGFGEGQLFGIASADNFCGVTERGIAFTFDVTHTDPQITRQADELCATVAHEIGHLVGLYHESIPADLMSYELVQSSPPKSFKDENAQCGTYPNQTFPCDCPLGNQSVMLANSYRILERLIGLKPIETNPPTVAIKEPTGSQVGPSFNVVVNATDDTGVESVTVFLDGQSFGTATMGVNGDYTIEVRNAPEGTFTLKASVKDQAGNPNIGIAEKSITIVKLATGEACVDNGACRGGLCAQDPVEGNYCTESCTTSNDTCPDGFACADLGNGQAVCGISEDSGCCSASPNVGAAGFLSLLVGAVLFRRRRRS